MGARQAVSAFEMEESIITDDDWGGIQLIDRDGVF
jgi:hypothetical protein